MMVQHRKHNTLASRPGESGPRFAVLFSGSSILRLPSVWYADIRR